RADQDDGAVLHHREKTVLLGAIESVNLVDEKQRALPHFAAAARLLEYFLEIGDTGEDRRNLLEMQVGCLRQQPGDGGLAGAGRSPEHQRTEGTRCQHSRERPVGPEEMILADTFVKLLRPELVCKRTRCVLVQARGSEQTRAVRFRPRRHPLNTAEIFCPPRKMLIRQLRLGVLFRRSRSRVLLMRSPLTSSITSPRWNPRLLAQDPASSATIATPRSAYRSRSPTPIA